MNGCTDEIYDAQYYANGESMIMMENNDYDFRWRCFFEGNQYEQQEGESNYTTSIFESSFKTKINTDYSMEKF